MARQRITPGSGLDPALGRPVGPAEDTFNPYVGTAAKSRLDNLARSLRSVGEAGQSFYQQQAKRQDEEDAKRGQQAFMEALEDQKNVAEAIRSARMRPGASKWFRWGVERAAGGAAARRARDHFVATKAEALEEADTLEEFDRIAGEAFDEYRETLGPVSEAFDNGFMPTYMAQLEELRYNFAVGIDGKLAGEFVENFAANQFDQLDSAHAFGMGMSMASLGAGDATDNIAWAAMAEGITRDLDEAARTNPGLEKELKAATAKNLILMAKRTRDDSYLDLAKEIRVGPEEQGEGRPTLEGTFSAEFTKARQDVVDARRAERKAVQDQLQLDRQIAAQDTAVRIAQITDGRSLSDPQVREEIDSELNRLRLVAPLQASALENTLRSNVNYADDTNPAVYENLRYRISTGDLTTAELFARRGELSYGDFSSLMGTLDTLNRANRDGTSQEILSLEPIKTYEQAINGRFEDVFEYVAESDKAEEEARQIFRRQMVLRRGQLMDLVNEFGVNSPQVEDFVRQEYNDAIYRTMSQMQSELTTSLLRPPPRLQTEPIPAEQLPGRFTATEVQSIGSMLARGTHNQAQDLWPSPLKAFAQRWTNLRPDAPVGSQEFDVLWRGILDAYDSRLTQQEGE